MNYLIVQPGRYGDILNCLPIAWHLAGLGHRVRWAVCDQFADVFEAVSYVRPVRWRGHYMDGRGAAGLAEPGETVLPLRCDGRVPADSPTGSFASDAWHRAGLADRWDDLPLVLDRRAWEREARFVDRFTENGERFVLTHAGGHSSPCPAARGLFAELAARVRLIDAGTIYLRSVVDMLALIERAAVVVSADTYLLHLTYAAGTPTVGLVADAGGDWYGTRARAHWIGRVPYSRIETSGAAIAGLVQSVMEPR